VNRFLVLAAFLLLTVGGGLLIGVSNPPGVWYADLDKAWFNPPDWVFAPAWTILYVLVGIAGWRVWRGGELRAFRLWWAQLALNFRWTPVFFTLHWVGTAVLVIAALFAVILIFIRTTWREDRASALCFVPYAAWVAYAGLLNLSIWWLN